MKLATTLEAEPPPAGQKPGYPGRDIDKISPELIENPRRSDYWDRFPHEMEVTGLRTLDLSGRRVQLAAYYQVDPVTLDTVRDPLTGDKLTDGPGTMQELLNEVIEKASRQLNRLNDTRHQLTNCREELVSAVDDLNGRKRELRVALNTVVNREQQIAKLQDTVKTRERTILERDEKIAELNDQIGEQKEALAKAGELKEEMEGKIAQLSFDLEKALGMIGAWKERPNIRRILTHGEKGSVASIDPEWNFVILNVTKDFVDQYVAARKKGVDVSELELSVMRDWQGERQFVTKVEVTRVVPERRVAVATLLNDWQQLPIRSGDMVMF
jgi:hypothetical protein